jgi:hypothetical protein
MKRYISIITLLAVAFSFNSCRKAKKNFDEYLPVVKTVSAVVQADGSVLVTGQLESPGEADILRIGLCCSTGSSPVMNDHQIICTLSGDQFSGSFDQLSIDSSYNFRTWATNKYGYSYGNVISLASVAPPSTAAPCTLAAESYDNGATFGSGTYYGSPQLCYYSSGLGSFQMQCNSTSITVQFDMSAPLSQGMWSITTSTSPGTREMHVSFTTGSYFVLNSGTAYVNDIGGGLFDVAICDAPWTLTSSTTLHFKTHFTAKNV